MCVNEPIFERLFLVKESIHQQICLFAYFVKLVFLFISVLYSVLFQQSMKHLVSNGYGLPPSSLIILTSGVKSVHSINKQVRTKHCMQHLKCGNEHILRVGEKRIPTLLSQQTFSTFTLNVKIVCYSKENRLRSTYLLSDCEMFSVQL